MRSQLYRPSRVIVLIFSTFILTQLSIQQDGPRSEQLSSRVQQLLSIPAVQAKPKPKKKRGKRKRRKRYERARRASQKLLDAGSSSVQITLKTKPRVRAVVYHGKEELGVTPLQLTWAKDTGPIDIKLKAAGYLTVNSRLYTHRNDHVTVNMFKTDEAHLLFGYKKKVKSKTEESLTEGGESSPQP